MSDNEESDIDDIEEIDKGDSDKDEKEEKIIPLAISTKKLLPDSDTDDDLEDLEDLEDESESLADEGELYSETIQKQVESSQLSPINSDIESDDDDYLQKFDKELHNEYITKTHPECLMKNAADIENLTQITRDSFGNIIDENHKTNPFLTKYERTRILGQRAKQINHGDKPYIAVPSDIMEGYLIAQLELKKKAIPVIIRRPLPGGNSEYWKLQDLEII
jgi:DNA-directed RNA polymerase subunit K/omega